MKKMMIKAIKVFCEAGLAAVFAMLGINVSGCCMNPRFAEVMNEYSK